MLKSGLVNSSAVEVVEGLRRGDVSPLECLDALEVRISEVDGRINALPTLCFKRARAHARVLMQKPVAERGVLAGLPVPIKDLTDVEGVRSTHGSPIFANAVPEKSDLLVTRLEAEGGVIYAKSNTPEFGAGANTFNEVFGSTVNPYNTKMSAAGSSGGAAAALASGMAWVAHGSDLGGSLRNPASFCGIVGLRPSPGRVAFSKGGQLDGSLAVEGPMARTVDDCALLLDAMAGDDLRDPLSKPRPTHSFLVAARARIKPLRVAYSPDLGITPVDPQVAEITRRAAHRFADAGVIVEETHPDLSDAYEIFQVLRAHSYAIGMSGLLRDHRDKLKPEVIWNTEKGLAQPMEMVVKAELARTALAARMADFFEKYDVLLCPATIVPPFPVGERYVKQCNDVDFATYVDWLLIVAPATLAACPALSLPCGFTKDGLPVGLQMIGASNGDARLLSAAGVLEDVLGLQTVRPVDPRS